MYHWILSWHSVKFTAAHDTDCSQIYWYMVYLVSKYTSAFFLHHVIHACDGLCSDDACRTPSTTWNVRYVRARRKQPTIAARIKCSRSLLRLTLQAHSRQISRRITTQQPVVMPMPSHQKRVILPTHTTHARTASISYLVVHINIRTRCATRTACTHVTRW